MSKKKSWAVQFKEFRVFAECVLDYLRSQVVVNDLEKTQNMDQGMNAHFVLRIATDRDWAADVRAQVKPFKQFCLSWIQFFHLYCESLPSALSGSLTDLKLYLVWVGEHDYFPQKTFHTNPD